jgi:CDP-glycerol glycerophosphotransferase (TagB/SpsB family)
VRDPDRTPKRPLKPARLPLSAHLIWLLGSLVPKTSGRIVVHSIPDWEDGLLALVAELRRRGREPFVLIQQSSDCPDPTLSDMSAVRKNSWRGRWLYLTAEYLITTHQVYRPHPVLRGQVAINIWHGEGTKPVGRFDGQAAVPCTWATSMSILGKSFKCAELGVAPSEVLVVGAPRNDRMLGADAATVRRRLGADAATQRLLLWLPTYRSSAVTGRTDGDAGGGPLVFSDADLRRLDGWLVDRGIKILAKLHPQAAAQASLPALQAIKQIDEQWLHSREVTLYQLLQAADGLLTDVSSVWVDFLLTGRPVVFAFPDYEAYRRTRGFLLEPYENWIVGPLATSIEQLTKELEVFDGGPDPFAGVRAEWRLRAHAFPDSESASRLLDAVGL